MSFKVLLMLVGILIFPLASHLVANSNENLTFASKMDDPQSRSNENLNLLEDVHAFGEIFDDYQMGSIFYQSRN